MLSRATGYLRPRKSRVHKACRQLEDEGYTILCKVLSVEEVEALANEINGVYDIVPPDGRSNHRRDPEIDQDFRYEMFNRSALCQEVVAHPKILKTIEPLLAKTATSLRTRAGGIHQRSIRDTAAASGTSTPALTFHSPTIRFGR